MQHARPQQPVSGRLTLTMRWAMVAVLGVLLVSMATGQSGIANYMELKRNRESLQQLVLELSIENQILETQLVRLKTSHEARLRYIKQEFGYVEPGEYVFHFSETQKTTGNNLAGPKKRLEF